MKPADHIKERMQLQQVGYNDDDTMINELQMDGNAVSIIIVKLVGFCFFEGRLNVKSLKSMIYYVVCININSPI